MNCVTFMGVGARIAMGAVARVAMGAVARVAILGSVFAGVLIGPVALAEAEQDAGVPPVVQSAPATPTAHRADASTDAAAAERSAGTARVADNDAPTSPALDALLNRTSEDTPDAKRCIRQASIDKTDVLNSNIIVFKDERKRIFINQMPVKCPDLRPGAKVVYTSRGDGQLCQLDSINVLHPGAGGLTTGPSCMLGKFEPISQDQLDVLKERYTPDGKDLIEAIFE